MANNQIVDFEAMARAKVAFETAFTESNDAYQKISTTIGGLPNVWTGQAATPYSGAMHTWLTNFGKVVTALGHMKDTLESGTKEYQANEDANQQMVTRISTDLAGLPGDQSFPGTPVTPVTPGIPPKY
ncbi:WXG100 family type VII secretion target [Frankia sp. CiP3]|uniref:WXG100 family type VII secretion target n=1 Tax=Frankia sp. CiP3 TaxID=2880971 RepID=UPI001EF4BEAD|nr:WXG100 family type VII secretion target [Frankia sp. CiP3]